MKYFCCFGDKQKPIIQTSIFYLKKRRNFANENNGKQMLQQCIIFVVTQFNVNNNTIKNETKYSSRKLENEQTLRGSE